MRIGMIGLGRMGANMVRRLVQGGHECVVYDAAAAAVRALQRRAHTRGRHGRRAGARARAAARRVDHGAGGARRHGDR